MLADERFDQLSWTVPWVRHQHLARYDWALSLSAGRRVLDAACGSGYGSRIFAQSSRVVGLDLSPVAVRDALRRSPGARLLAGDTTALPFPTGGFDIYASFETIEHVRDDHAYVREARRVVAEGGLFLCSTPNRRLVNPANSLSDTPFNRYHVREYAAHELQQLLGRAFSNVQLLGQTEYSGRYAAILSLAGRIWPLAAVRLHQLRKLAGFPFETRAKHQPCAFGQGVEPEILIAICR